MYSKLWCSDKVWCSDIYIDEYTLYCIHVSCMFTVHCTALLHAVNKTCMYVYSILYVYTVFTYTVLHCLHMHMHMCSVYMHASMHVLSVHADDAVYSVYVWWAWKFALVFRIFPYLDHDSVMFAVWLVHLFSKKKMSGRGVAVFEVWLAGTNLS